METSNDMKTREPGSRSRNNSQSGLSLGTGAGPDGLGLGAGGAASSSITCLLPMDEIQTTASQSDSMMLILDFSIPD